jgi:uncharacterized protein YndB with AHSA1/START domain/mannose-6-phosphate isomerase-like protein (cupin superfamily)
MAKSGDVLELDPLGVRVELLRTAEDTGGELLEFDVTGRARGIIARGHLHTSQTERHEVLSEAMKLVIDGEEHLLTAGQSMEVPAGTPHSQIPAGDGPGRVRVQVRPAGESQALLERLADLCRDGQINRFGLPRPRAGAALLRDFGHTGRPTQPPLAVQRALSRLVLGIADLGRPYVFVDEWEVAAPPEAVWGAIADARTYPEWWRPVYIDVEADGPAQLGKESRQHFKGRLPYHLHTRSVTVALDPPHSITGDVDGDLRGRGTWTLTPSATGTHVRFDWQVHADRRLLRVLTPVLRPLFRWNHNWAIARAIEGLEPYAQRVAAPSTERVPG